MKISPPARKIRYLIFFVLLCPLAGLLYFVQNGSLFKGTAKEIVEKEYTDHTREAFILDALLNVKRSPPKKTVFEFYEIPPTSAIDWSPQEKAVFKFSEAVSVGFDLGRERNLSSLHVYERGGALRRVYETFYAPLENELKEFLPQLKEVVGFDVHFVNAREEIAEDKHSKVNIRIVRDYVSTKWVDGKPVFLGNDNALIEDDARLRDDVVTFNTLSPFLKGYAYFDQGHNLTWAECHMWIYMEPSDRRAAMRECIVRALGVVGEIKGQEHFQSPILPDILKKTLSFLYCREVRGGMHREEILQIIHSEGCL
jgi:hypothetical protein